ADWSTSRRAASASLTLSLARLIAATCVLRSSGDILPSVASSAEIDPFLPRAPTRTASSAGSSLAAAIWPRIDCSSVARSDTANLPLVVPGEDRPAERATQVGENARSGRQRGLGLLGDRLE